MAVKASATITLTSYRDTQSVTRYYKLRPAGSSAPLKPETKPPSSDWTDSEPDCDISKELYFCDLTIFSNGEGEYSKVSKLVEGICLQILYILPKTIWSQTELH